MKKFAAVVLLIFVMLSFSACDPSFGSIGEFFDRNGIISADLIEYDNPSAKRINSGFWSSMEDTAKKLLSFDFDKMTVLESVAEEILSDFLSDVSEIAAATTWVHLDSPIGICIKLNYENGDFAIISCGQLYGKEDALGCLYSASGTPSLYIAEPYGEDFQKVINKYSGVKV